MYNLTLTNESGAQLTFGMGGAYTISEIDGLSSPEATINTSEVALMDGQRYNSSKVSMRTLSIAFAIEYDAEQKRLDVYNVLRIKKPIHVHYKSDLRDVTIDGYVSKLDVDHFAMKQIATVTIICPSPYFRSAQMVVNELSNIIKAFHFPFAITEAEPIPFSYIQQLSNVTIENGGTTDTGMTIVLYARGAVNNPKIFNYVTQEFFGLNFSMQAGDEITIDTMAGEKSVTLLRDGATSNLFNYVMADSTWLQVEGIQSMFVYEVGSGTLSDLVAEFSHYDLFAGV